MQVDQDGDFILSSIQEDSEKYSGYSSDFQTRSERTSHACAKIMNVQLQKSTRSAYNQVRKWKQFCSRTLWKLNKGETSWRIWNRQGHSNCNLKFNRCSILIWMWFAKTINSKNLLLLKSEQSVQFWSSFFLLHRVYYLCNLEKEIHPY